MLVGIDVAKAELVIAVRPSGERWSVTNDERGVGRLVERLRFLTPQLIVLEATGGYELLGVAALAAAALPVVVVNPRQVRDFARATGQLAISHETIYRYIWADKRRGGQLHTHLRGAPKQCRKRYGSYERRGRLRGKRPITERPASIETRREGGHWEMDTVLGTGDRHCVLSLVERTSGYLVLGKLTARTTAAVTRRAIQLIRHERQPVHTLTTDNGTEFHDYARLERATGTTVYFATPHHAWERGTNENTNGLLRQYLPRGQSMARVTQQDCPRIARALNTRPRKRHHDRTPEDCYARLT